MKLSSPFRNGGIRVLAGVLSLLLVAETTSASANTLFSTSYESPVYSPGPLSGQDGWVNSFDIDPMVTSTISQTGAQALEVRKTASDNGFGLTFRPGPYASSLPRISVQHSIYLEGTAGWADSFLSPLALIGENGFVGQLAIRNGLAAEFFDVGSAPIQTDTWIDLEVVLDFQTQTQEAFVDGASIGTAPFDNPASELVQVEIFHIIPTDETPFYVDDLSITAVPEPSGGAIVLAGLAALGVVVCRRSR